MAKLYGLTSIECQLYLNFNISYFGCHKRKYMPTYSCEYLFLSDNITLNVG